MIADIAGQRIREIGGKLMPVRRRHQLILERKRKLPKLVQRNKRQSFDAGKFLGIESVVRNHLRQQGLKPPKLMPRQFLAGQPRQPASLVKCRSWHGTMIKAVDEEPKDRTRVGSRLRQPVVHLYYASRN